MGDLCEGLMGDAILRAEVNFKNEMADYVFDSAGICFDMPEYRASEIRLDTLLQYKLSKKTVLKVMHNLACTFIEQTDGDEGQPAGVLRQVISHMIFNENDIDNYVAIILNFLNSKDFNLKDFKNYIEKELGDVVVTSAVGSTVRGLKGTLLSNSSAVHKNLVGQIGTRPVPHLIRVRTGEKIFITKSEFRIGKSKIKTDYTLENNNAISRIHCTVEQKDGINYIVDNNSTNHTYVDGIQIEPGVPTLLRNKAKIRLGDEEFVFYLRNNEGMAQI